MAVMSEIAIVVGLCLFAYSCGSVPFGKMIGYLGGVNVQKLGSRNIGATNIYRVMKGRRRRKRNLGRVIAVIIEETNLRSVLGESFNRDKAIAWINAFFDKIIAGGNAGLAFGLDAGKGAFPVFLAVKVLGYPSPISSWVNAWSIDLLLPVIITSLVAASSVIGARYSIWLKIKTGKFKAGKGIATYIGILAMILGWKACLVVLIFWFFFVFIFVAGGRMSAASLILIGGSPALYLIFPIPMLVIFLPFMIFMAVWSHWENIKKLIKGKEKPVIHISFFSLPDLLARYFPPKGKKPKNKP